MTDAEQAARDAVLGESLHSATCDLMYRGRLHGGRCDCHKAVALDAYRAVVRLEAITAWEISFGICHNYAPTPGKSNCGNCESCRARGHFNSFEAALAAAQSGEGTA